LPGQDDAYSAIIRDRSGNGNDGTITGATWARTGKGHWYLSYDGVDDYIQIGDNTTFKWMHGGIDAANFKVTTKFWLALPTPEPDTMYGLVCTCISSSGNTGYYLGYDDRFSQGLTRTFRLFIPTGVAGQPVVTAVTNDSAVANDSKWHHVVVTYDQSLANTNALFYVDGVLLGTRTQDKTAFTPSSGNSSNELHIGTNGGETDDSMCWMSLHTIVEVIWSAAQVARNYNQERHLFGV